MGTHALELCWGDSAADRGKLIKTSLSYIQVLRGDKTKQISITKSADNKNLRGSLIATLASGQTFPFQRRVNPKLPKSANTHPQRGTATPLRQHLASTLPKTSSGFSSCPSTPVSHTPTGKAHLLQRTSCPKQGPKGYPAAFLTLCKTMR